MREVALNLMVVLAGCGPEAPSLRPEALLPVLAGVDSLTRETGLLSPLAEALSGGAVGQVAANRAALTAGGFFEPNRCVSAQAMGASVRYHFNRCAGPLGLQDLSGTLDATFAGVGTPLPSARSHALGLHANGATMDFDNTLQFDFSEPRVVTLRVSSTATGVGALGVRFERRGEHSLRWERDTRCVTINGQWTGAGGSVTTVSNFRRCVRRCPEPGAMVRLLRPTQEYTLTLSFPGGTRGVWQSARGAESAMGTFLIACEN